MIKNYKKKLLMVGDSHLHVLLNAYEMLSTKFNVHVYCSKKHEDKLNTKIKKKFEFFKYNEGWIYLYLIFKSFNYNYIYISTGPQEVNRKSGLIVLFFYIFFILLHGNKTILGIRNNRKYFKGVCNHPIDRLCNFIRNISISKIKIIFFETKTNMKNFKKKFNKVNVNYFVNYPLHINKRPSSRIKISNKIIKIGILGTLNPERKNYELLINAIKKLNKNLRDNMLIVVLGFVKNGSKNEIIKKIKKYVKVEFEKGYILQSKFEKLSLSCHFFISPLKKGFGGANKGTGSIFDSISAKKPLILPQHADPNHEFKDFCFYYFNTNDLSKIMDNFIRHKHKPLRDKIFYKYNNKQIMNELNKFI